MSAKKTGFDIYWPEIKERELRLIDPSLPKEERKQLLRKALKEAWKSLNGDIKDIYEQRAKGEAIASTTMSSSGEAVTKASSGGSKSSGSTQRFFQGNGWATKKATPAKENSPVDNGIPRFNSEIISGSSSSSSKRRKTIAEKHKE